MTTARELDEVYSSLRNYSNKLSEKYADPNVPIIQVKDQYLMNTLIELCTNINVLLQSLGLDSKYEPHHQRESQEISVTINTTVNLVRIDSFEITSNWFWSFRVEELVDYLLQGGYQDRNNPKRYQT